MGPGFIIFDYVTFYKFCMLGVVVGVTAWRVACLVRRLCTRTPRVDPLRFPRTFCARLVLRCASRIVALTRSAPEEFKAALAVFNLRFTLIVILLVLMIFLNRFQYS